MIILVASMLNILVALLVVLVGKDLAQFRCAAFRLQVVLGHL